MGKLLAAAGVVVIGLLVLLWLQLREPAAAVIAAPKKPTPAEMIASVETKSGMAKDAEKVAAAVADSGKIDPASDEFFFKFYDLQPHMLTREAAKCYTGGLHRVHRNQKLKLGFRNHIEHGEVTVTGVHIIESTINDPELVDCFVKAVAGTHWHEERLPDYDESDELVIRPERGMKKYTKENMEYETDTPDFSKIHPLTAPRAAPSPDK